MKRSNKTLFIILTLLLAGCTRSVVYQESAYPYVIIGSWTSTAGETKETLKLKDDSTFVARMQPQGFLAQTLSQPLAGTLKGKWVIHGNVITLEVEKEKNVQAENRTTSSTILKMKSDSLVLQSGGGEVTVFIKNLHL